MVIREAEENNLLSAGHFTVDGTLIQAWTASRNFQQKSGPPAPGEGSGKRGELLRRDKVESKSDTEVRLYKTGNEEKSVPVGGDGVQSDAPGQADSDAGASGLRPRCLCCPEKGLPKTN